MGEPRLDQITHRHERRIAHDRAPVGHDRITLLQEPFRTVSIEPHLRELQPFRRTLVRVACGAFEPRGGICLAPPRVVGRAAHCRVEFERRRLQSGGPGGKAPRGIVRVQAPFEGAHPLGTPARRRGGVSRLHLIFAKVYDEQGAFEGIGGFLAHVPVVRNNRLVIEDGVPAVRLGPSAEMLTGSTGIALALLAASTAVDPAWDRLLGIS